MDRKEKGSMLVIALITVLILSFIVASGIRTTTTELFTTYNYYLKKASYYYAVAGVESVAVLVKNSEDPSSIILNETKNTEDGATVKLFTGDLETGVSSITIFQGFQPPPLPGISLGTTTSIKPIIWEINLASELTKGKRKSYSEIEAGIYSLMMGY